MSIEQMIRAAVEALPALPMGQHYVRVTFPASWCAHDYDSPTQVAWRMAREAGLQVVRSKREAGTVAVYAIEPSTSDARAWDRYRNLRCSSAQRVAS